MTLGYKLTVKGGNNFSMQFGKEMMK